MNGRDHNQGLYKSRVLQAYFGRMWFEFVSRRQAVVNAAMNYRVIYKVGNVGILEERGGHARFWWGNLRETVTWKT